MSWARRILRVDLTKGTCTAEPLNMEWARAYIGSRGLATKYYTSEVDAKVDPLSPANKIIWATGPLTGTMASTGGRSVTVLHRRGWQAECQAYRRDGRQIGAGA